MATPRPACRGGRGAAHLAPVLCAFVVLALATLVQGRHASLAYTAEKDAFTAVDLPFGFYAGGSMHTSAAYPAGTTNDVPVTFMLCSFAARDALLHAHGTIGSLCAANVTGACEWVAQLNSDNTFVYFDGTADTTDLYQLLALNCATNSVEVEVAYKFVNPGGEHLSTTMIPFKTLSLVFSIAWGVVFAGWFLNYLRNRRISNPLFRGIGIVPLLTTIQQCVALVYWRSLSETGDQNVFLLLVMLALAGICTSLLLAILVLIAKGWQITRPTMLDSEWRNVGVMTVVFLVSYVTFLIFEGFFFLFLLILVYVLVLRYLFSSVSTNMRVIIFQLRYMRAANPNVPEGSLLPARQLRAIRVFRSALPVYIILDIMLHVWSMMALQRSPWAEAMLVNGCTLTVVCFVCIVFRLQRNSVYYQDAFNTPLMAAVQQEVPEVVVIRNPDTMDEHGKRVISFGVGVPAANSQGYCQADDFTGTDGNTLSIDMEGYDGAGAGAGAGAGPGSGPGSARSGDGTSAINVDVGALAPLLASSARTGRGSL